MTEDQREQETLGWKLEANDFTPSVEVYIHQAIPDAHACRMGAYLDWFVQRIVKMNAVFRPVIQEL